MKTLKQIIEDKGYTVKDFEDTVTMLTQRGIAKGCFQDYTLLCFVLDLLTNLDREMTE